MSNHRRIDTRTRRERRYVSLKPKAFAFLSAAAKAVGVSRAALVEQALAADPAFRDYVPPPEIVIKDTMTGRYYCDRNPRFPAMGGTIDEATRFPDRVAAADALRQMPLTVLVEVEEVPRG